MYYIPFERGKTKFLKNINFMKIGTGVPRQFYPDFGQVCRRNPYIYMKDREDSQHASES